MASRDVLTSVEDLAAVVGGNATVQSLSADEDASLIVDQVARICLSDRGLQELGAIMPMIVDESDSFCGILIDAAKISFTATVAQGLEFLKNLLEKVKFEKTIRQHILLSLPRLWDCGHAIWKLTQSAKARAGCVDLLSEVAVVAAKSDKINDLGVSDVLTSMLGEARRHVGKATMGVTVKQPLYNFFGTVAHVAPLFASEHVDTMFSIFVSEIKKEMKDKDPKFAIIAGSLEGLDGLLHNFASAEKAVSNMDVIFTTCRKVIRLTDVSRYAMIFAALKLLSHHMEKFVKDLLAEKSTYVEIYQDLKRWATHPSNSGARKLGFETLGVFLKQVSRSIVLHMENGTNLETCHAAFSFFISEFNDKIKKADNPREMTLAVQGYGFFVASCRRLSSPDQIALMLNEMLQKSEETFFNASTGLAEETRLEHLPIFVDTLATMVQDSGIEVPDAFLSTIQRLCLLMMEMFPKFGPSQQNSSCQAIVKTILIVTRSCPTVGDFVSTIVYQGLLKSCSFPIPPENANDSAVSSSGMAKKIVSYKDFQPLWNKLCGCDFMKGLLKELEASEMEVVGAARLIFDEFIRASLQIMQTLNLQLVNTEEEEETVTVDFMPVDKKPANQEDFQIFFSLEQIFVATLSKASPELIVEHSEFPLEIMKISEKNPLVSGLYRLLEAWFLGERKISRERLTDETGEDSNGDVKMEVEVSSSILVATEVVQNHSAVSSFMRNLVGRLQHFFDEVLISALRLILNFPLYAVEANIASAMDAVGMALQAGQSFLPLAEATLLSLRRWCFSAQLDRKLLSRHFAKILPLLDAYLRSTTLNLAERSKLTLGSGKSRRKMPAVSSCSVDTDQAALTKVRELILSFLGQLGGKYNHLILDADFLSEVKNLAVVWDMTQHLQFSFPFVDMMLGNFYLDSFLPRVTELCLYSPDRPTKVAACELLHAITVFLVGTHSEMAPKKREKSTLMDLIGKLVPKILQLACDVEPVTRQIFQPLILQMIHWFSRTAQKASAEANAILDCLMDGLVAERNPAIRSFCARCLKEFLEWSSKSQPANQKTVPLAAASMLERIISYAGHSSSAKRFGAALAFSQCYRTFRENGAIVDVFTIDLVVTFTKSLALCHRDPPGFGSEKVVELCLLHLARIVEKFSKILAKISSKRRSPVELQEATLEKLVIWLLLQACRPETACRISSWTLFDRFFRILENSTSTEYFFENLRKSKSQNWLLKAFLSAGFDPDEGAVCLKPDDLNIDGLTEDGGRLSMEKVQWLAAAIDCFAWSFDKAYLKIAMVNGTPEWELFGDLLAVFLHKFLLVPVGPETLLFSSTSEGLRTAICSILIRITDLITCLFARYGKVGGSILPVVVFSSNFAEVVIRATLDPASVGFDVHDAEVQANLANQMQQFLNVMTTHAAVDEVKTMRQAAVSVLQKTNYDLVLLMKNRKTEDIQQGLIAGYKVLHEVGLDKDYLLTKSLSAQQFSEDLLRYVEASLKSKYSGSGSRREAWIAVAASQEKSLFGLSLLYGTSIGTTVVHSISSSQNRIVFYSKLRSVFFKFLFSDSPTPGASGRQEIFFEALLCGDIGQSVETWTSRHGVVKDALEFLVRNRSARKIHGEKVVEFILQRYGTFIQARPEQIELDSEVLRTILHLIKMLLLLDTTILKKTSQEIRKLYEFYVDILSTPSSSNPQMAATKNRALLLLSPFLSGVDGVLVEKAIEEMYINDFPLKAAELLTASAQYAFYLQAVNLILHAVDLSKNMVVLEICIKLLCRDENHPLLDRFQDVFKSIVADDHSHNVQKIFDIPWKIFTNVQYGPEHRRTAVEKILLLMLRSATQIAGVEFYSRIIKEIVDLLQMKERFVTLGFLTVQTCCFSLLEVLCANLPKTELISPTAKVVVAFCRTRNVEEHAIKGTELVQFITRTTDAFAHENMAAEPGMEETTRLFHCAAYRTLVAAITATQTELKFYHACLFEQKPEKGRLLWTNLVDLRKEYEFEVEFIQAPKKKLQLAAIHKEISQVDGVSSSLSSGIFTATSYASARLASASLIQGSSFSEDMSRYDYSEGLDRTSTPLSALRSARSDDERSTGSVVLEMDALNQHECMATLVALIGHMVENKITPVGNGAEAPNWILALKHELQSSTSPLNVKLFLAKLILNIENSEKPYFGQFAGCLYGTLMDLLLEIDCRHGINYFVVDLMHVMLKWTIVTPVALGDKLRIQKVFVFLIQHIKHSNSQVQKNNLTLLKVLTEAWRSLLESPARGVVTDLLVKDKAKAKLNIPVINIVAIILKAGLPLSVTSFEEFRKILFLHLQESCKPLYSVAAFTLGLLLSAEIEAPPLEAAFQELGTFLSALVDKDKLVAVLQQVCKSSTHILPTFLSRVLFVIPTLPGNLKSGGLEVLLAGADAISDPFVALKSCGILSAINDSNETIQGLTLELFRKIAPRMATLQFEELLVEMGELGLHNSPLLRQQYYEFCMWIYEHFENAKEEERLLQSVRERLFAGLKDRDKPIRELLTAFWANEKRMTGSTFMRLMTLCTNFVTPQLETSFLSTACHLLMGFSRRSPLFGSPLFRTALTDCQFFKQEIATSWKQRSSVLPVTASTFAGGSFSASYSGSSYSTQKAPIFTPTQLPGGPVQDTLAGGAGFSYASEFSQSLLIDFSKHDSYARGGDDVTQMTQDEHLIEISRVEREVDAIKRRFQSDSGDQGRSFFAKREIDKKKERQEALKNQRERQSLDVTLSRVYRIGDVPDVQIAYSAILEPLQILAEHDMQTSSLLLKNLFGGIVAQARTKSEAVDEQLEILAQRLDSVLRSQSVTDTMFLTTLLNIILQDSPKESKLLESVSPSAITSAALKSNQPHLGIAVLENGILLNKTSDGRGKTSEPVQKRSRPIEVARSEHWLGMYQLLLSIGETDSIVGLELDKIFQQSDDVRSAVQAEARGDFAGAAEVYAKLCQTPADESPQCMQVLQESYMRCLDELGRWQQLQIAATPSQDENSQQCGDMDALWEDHRWVETSMPYAIKATLSLALDGDDVAGQTLEDFFMHAKEIPARKALLWRKFGNQVAICYFLMDNPSEAGYHLEKFAAKNFLEDWAATTQLNLHSRRKQLPLVQLIGEAQRCLENRNAMSHVPEQAKRLTEEFLDFLADGQREADLNDTAGVWNDLVSNRCFFSAYLAKNAGSNLNSSLLGSFHVHEKLSVVRTAIRQHNFGLADRIMQATDGCSRQSFPDSTFFSSGSLRRLEDRWSCVYEEAAVARSRFYQTAEQAAPSLKKLMQALRLVDKIRQKSPAANAGLLRSQEADVLLAIADLLQEHGVSAALKAEDQLFLGLAGGANDVKPLYARVFSDFTEACEKATDATPFLRAFQYCEQLLDKGVLDDAVLVATGTSLLIKAIKLGSVEARDLFCKLLVWLGEYPVISESFRLGCAEIPAWMFLSWSNQILALLDKPAGLAIHDILGRMAKEYPQAIIYGFKISRESFVFDEKEPVGKRNKQFFAKLSEMLDIPLVDEFVGHLIRLCEPFMFFQDFFKRAEHLLKLKKKEQLRQEYEEIYKRVFADESGSLGTAWTTFVAKFRESFITAFGTKGKKISTLSCSQFRPGMAKLDSDLQKQKGQFSREDEDKMVNLSPWLAEFSSLKYGNLLEIPGQYDGREKPRPETHVKIASFGNEVKTLTSIRRPRRIVIRGDDEKDYPFLVKGGEDLRLDQRIEQLFVLMNRVFDQNADCAKRHLQIRTYKVVPMTTQIGMIEWVQGSLQLVEFLRRGQADGRLDELLQTARHDRYALMKKAMKIPEKKQFANLDRDLNTLAFTEMSSSEMRKMFRQLCQPFDSHLLRRQLQRLTVSPDAFVIVRNLFAQTYGVMSVGQYVLGIGDRHLSNCMVSTETGLMFPIDFGHAFGSGVQSLPIPELAPIRLTGQFVDLMAPLSLRGLMQQSMVHAMRALRKERQILMATMDVFVQEPSMDWLQSARKISPEVSSQDELLWFPREKIKTAERKLLGGNPAYITRDEVRSNLFFQKDKGLMAKIEEVCIGDSDGIRARYGDQNLSVEAQIECLVDQSTDENVIGRVFWGWNPWV